MSVPWPLVSLFLALALAALGWFARVLYGDLKKRLERTEETISKFPIHYAGRGELERVETAIAEIPIYYARRDDFKDSLDEIKGSFPEVFEQLRRANEGIALLRGREESES